MKAGAAEIDITPDFEVELCGFAARTQPAIGVLEPIYARGIYLTDGAEKLLLVACDVIALGRELVEAFRAWCRRELGLEARQVMLCATHTHSAPATIDLTSAGRRSDRFVELLLAKLKEAAKRASESAAACEVVFAAAPLDLAIDRRKTPSSHVDPLVWAVGFARVDGSYVAAITNYAMHPVALGHIERRISPDWCGAAASELSMRLPGRPITLVTNSAAGNINPPAQGIDPEQVRAYGRAVAQTAARALAEAKPPGSAQGRQASALAVRSEIVPIPLDVLDDAGIDAAADAFIASLPADHIWKGLIDRAANTWRAAMKQTIAKGGGGTEAAIEIQAARIGELRIVAVNGELFSRFTDELRKRTSEKLFVIGYANAAFGYIPTREAYAEGGYEPEQAHFFYNSFRPRPGGLEMLMDRAAELVKELSP